MWSPKCRSSHKSCPYSRGSPAPIRMAILHMGLRMRMKGLASGRGAYLPRSPGRGSPHPRGRRGGVWTWCVLATKSGPWVPASARTTEWGVDVVRTCHEVRAVGPRIREDDGVGCGRGAYLPRRPGRGSLRPRGRRGGVWTWCVLATKSGPWVPASARTTGWGVDVVRTCHEVPGRGSPHPRGRRGGVRRAAKVWIGGYGYWRYGQSSKDR